MYSACLFVLVLSGNAYSKTESSGLKAINSTRAAVERSKLEEVQRQLAIEHLDAARADELEIETLNERLNSIRSETADQPARMEQLQKALATDREQELGDWSKRIPTNADGKMLEQLLERERNIVNDLRTQIERIGEELAMTLSRPIQTENEVSSLHRRLEELAAPAVMLKDEPILLFEARRLRRNSEYRRLEKTLELHATEQNTATQRQSMNELALRELRYRVGIHERRIEILQQRIKTRGRSELELILQQLINREQALADNNAIVVSSATENRIIGDELIQQHEHLSEDRAALASIEEARERISVILQDSRTRLDVGGTDERVGRWLWSERRQLKSAGHLQNRLKLIHDDLADLRLKRVMLSEQQRDLLGNGTIQNITETHVDKDILASLLQKRAELLPLLESLLKRRISVLEESARSLQDQIKLTWELQQLLDRHVLWIPDHSPIDHKWLQRLPEGLYDLIKPSRFMTLVELSLRDLRQHPLPWVGSLLFVVILLEFRRRAPARIEALAVNTYQIRKDSYQTTLNSLGWTLLAALPVPVTLALIGQLLQGIGNPGRFSHSFGQACLLLAMPLLAVQILRWSSIEYGLGHAHFRWTRQRRTVLRSWLPRIAVVVLPLYFISTLAFTRRLDLAIDVQARMAIVLNCIVLAWALWKLLDAGRLWVIRGISIEPSNLRKLLRVWLPLLLLALAILALTGYVYSAGMMLQSLLDSFNIIVVIVIVVSLLTRWFLLGERRLALHRLEERRLAAAKSSEESGEVVPEPEENVTLEQVNTQNRRLLRALRLSLLGLGLSWVWADILPAISRLDEIVLWHFSDTGADGAPIQQSVTLMAASLGIATLALTIASARNLPGLIEISLLSYIRIDAASRYAITSVLRYAIIISGTLVGLGFLGIRWSQLQWMAAALTVGLGFGLQEIFANFVSGIILLFERPFRVGDVITVGGFSGRVTRIRTRATTLLDFDDKEVVIPNKTFITGQLTNWTLTDTVTRVIIKVGIAYGTDVNKVRTLLLHVAREDTRVLAVPEPSCWFMDFGANSLILELWVFVNTLSDRMEVQNALNTRITTLFAEHNIDFSSTV